MAMHGLRVQVPHEGQKGEGSIVHSELVLEGGVIMVAGIKPVTRPDALYPRSPRQLSGANTQTMMVYVDDADSPLRAGPGSRCEHRRRADDHGLW